MLSSDLRADRSEQKDELSESALGTLVGKPCSAAAPLIFSQLVTYLRDCKIGVRSMAQPTGDAFPLPTSRERIEGIPGVTAESVEAMQCMAVALNSYAGCEPMSERKMTAVHQKFLGGTGQGCPGCPGVE